MFSPINLTARAGLLLVSVFLFAGCNALGKSDEVPKEETASGVSVTLADAKTRLGAVCDNMNAVVSDVARDIERDSDDIRVKRFSLVLRFRVLQECQRILQLEDPRIGVLDLLALAHQLRIYFQTGDGRKVVGDALADAAVPPLNRYLTRLIDNAAFFVPETVYRPSLDAIKQFAIDNPITGETLVRTYRPSESLKQEGTSALRAVIELPFKPFQFGGGVSEAAVAIKDVSIQADKFSDILGNMPLQFLWAIQYLLYTLEENEGVADALASVKTAAEALDTVAKAADGLPEKVGAEVDKAIERIEKSQGEIQKTLEEAQQTSVEIKAAMAEASRTFETVNEASTSLTATAEAWLPTAKAFDHLLNPPSDPNETPDPDPFKMPQVTDASNALAGAAKELQTLVGDINKLIGSDEIPGTIAKVDDSAKAAVDHTALAAEDLADHITWRGIQLVLVIFGAAIVYRVVSWRLPKRGTA